MFKSLFFFVLVVFHGASVAKPLVLVSVLPQQSIVQQIAGDAAMVETIVHKGVSPEHYHPSAKTVVRLAEADLYVRAGLPFEQQLLPRLKKLNPTLQVLDMREGLELVDGDPHIWTDPTRVLQHTEYLFEVLAGLLPEHEDQLAMNLKAFRDRLDVLDRETWLSLEPLVQRNFLVYHPAWSYYAARYGMTQLAVEHHGKEPSAREMTVLLQNVRASRIKVLLVRPQQHAHMADVFAREAGLKTVSVDPLGEDYFVMIESLTRLLQEHNG